MSVVQLDSYRPHMEGKAKCLACKHEHHAVAPIGTSWMECPECHLFQCTWDAAVLKQDRHWKCNCGNGVFCIGERYLIYCTFCGAHQDVPIL